MATKAIKRYRVGMAGEFGVCAELFKRGYDVSMTMGNYKAVDIIVTKQGGGSARIEVKTSRSSRKTIVTGFFQKYFSKTQNPHPDFWVLVYIDQYFKSHYYVLTHDEMGQEQMIRNNMTYWHHVPKGCDNVSIKTLSRYENAWHKIPK